MSLRPLITELREALVEGGYKIGTKRQRKDGMYVKTAQGWERVPDEAAGPSPVDKLSPPEREFLRMRTQGVSDKQLMATLKLDLGTAMAMGNSIRSKLGLPPGGSLKDAGRQLGVK